MHRTRQHRAGAERVRFGQYALSWQQRSTDHRRCLNRQVIVQGCADRILSAVSKSHTRTRHDQITAEWLHTRQQFPACVIDGFRWWCKTVVDAAVDIQVATGANHQAAGLAGTVDRRLLRVRVEAGVTVAGQVQIALHHQIAVSGFAGDFHTGAQVECIGVGGVVQAGQFALQQIRIGQGCVDERGAVDVNAVQISLIDDLVRTTAGGRVGAVGGIDVAARGVEPNGARTLNVQRTAGIDSDIASTHTRCVEFQCAPRATVMLPRQITDGDVGAVTQIDPRTGGQRQQPIAGVQLDHGPVRCVDDLAVAIDPQHLAMGIKHCAASHGQAIFARQANAADAFATGVNQTHDGKTAVVHRDIDLTGLEPVANHQIALLELEAATAEHLSDIQTLVEGGEFAVEVSAAAQSLRANIHTACFVRHPGAARVVIAAAAAEDFPL
ncbi:hypothetical protein D3C86_813080 [compost metagenome]